MILTRTLRFPVKFAVATKNPVFRTNYSPRYAQPKHFFSALTSKMAQPKYLTGDKAGIDAFVDQFDVSCWDLTCFGLMAK
jgi:hypothetical protein